MKLIQSIKKAVRRLRNKFLVKQQIFFKGTTTKILCAVLLLIIASLVGVFNMDLAELLRKHNLSNYFVLLYALFCPLPVYVAVVILTKFNWNTKLKAVLRKFYGAVTVLSLFMAVVWWIFA